MKHTPPSGQDLVLALLHAARGMEARIEEELEGHGLSTAKYGLLRILADADEPLSLSELAKRFACVRSNITQLVDRLEADSLVMRVSDPSDRRTVLAALTRLGREKAAAGAAVMAQVHAEVLGKVPVTARTGLVQGLQALK